MARPDETTGAPFIDFQMILEASPEPAAILDRSFRFIAANQALVNILRSTAGIEISPLGNALDTVPPAIRPEVERGLEAVFAGETWTKEHPAGDRFLEDVFSPVRGRDGSIVAAFVRSRDVTDRVAARRELEALAATLEQRVVERSLELETVLQAVQDGYASLRVGGALIDVNEAFCRMVGYTREELLRMNIRDLDVAMTPPAIDALGSRVRSSGATTFETRHRRKDGGLVDFEATLNWVEVAGGRYVSFIRDVTSRKRAEEALRESETHLRRITDHMVDLVGEFDERQCFLFASPSYERVLGYHPGELIGTWGPEKIHPEEREKAIAEIGAILTAEKGSTRFRFRHKDGSYRWIESTGRVILDAEGRMVGSVMASRDVTDQEQAAKELKQRSGQLRLRSDELAAAVKELERASRAKDDFLASMSHELRTPLTGILGMAEVLRSGIHGDMSERQQRCLQIVEEGGRHLLSLINDILDVAKIEAGRLVLQPEPCSVTGMCRASVSMVQAAADRKRIDLSFEVDREATPVTADARRLQQILFNLLSNAVKFTPAGGRVLLEARVDPERREIRFVVSDTGPGIAKEDLQKLFQPFTQLDTRLAREHSGTGLGLALVRHMSELHSGRVEVESAPGKGSSFTVALPWFPRTDGFPSGTSFRPVPSAPPRPSPGASGVAPVVLLIDDDPAVAEVLRSYLGASGMRLDVAKSGSEGLDLVASLHPDVVLVDIQLPGMDGLEVIRILKGDGEGKGPGVIALTALAMTGDRERILAAGADDYMSKPIALQALAARIRTIADLAAPQGR